jgi:nitrate reductase delta subunit
VSAALFQTVALALAYPDEAWRERQLPLLQAVAQAYPAYPIGAFTAYAAAHPTDQLTRGYVDTFDLRRRCCLYLTYYTHGDTRKRGVALLRFTTAYREAGLELTGGELPDHLGLVCEVAARAPEVGVPLLTEHRAGIELLRMALTDADSPYVDVLDTLRAALPELAPGDLERALELARTGPPEEEVGLEPFAPPEYMGGRR